MISCILIITKREKMDICALASGSSGNCFYIQNGDDSVLIDGGINSKRIAESLSAIKRNPENIRGIFITHEHTDHIRGVDVFARQFNIPIFATKKTADKCFLCSDESLINFIKNNEVIEIGGMRVEAFSKSHLAIDPVFYNIVNGKKISIITDVGYSCKNVIANVSDTDFLFIESNYDDVMLEKGPYPLFLKEWIKGRQGHLSNLQSALCVLEHSSSRLKHVVLSHISKNNNTEELAFETFRWLLKERRDLSPKISISPREMPTQVFKI